MFFGVFVPLNTFFFFSSCFVLFSFLFFLCRFFFQCTRVAGVRMRDVPAVSNTIAWQCIVFYQVLPLQHCKVASLLCRSFMTAELVSLYRMNQHDTGTGCAGCQRVKRKQRKVKKTHTQFIPHEGYRSVTLLDATRAPNFSSVPAESGSDVHRLLLGYFLSVRLWCCSWLAN